MEFLRMAQALADLANKLVLSHGTEALGTSTKADKTFVTELDTRIEAALRAQIRRSLPTHGVLGEEYGAEKIDNDWVWVLDPIDGTMAMVVGMPVYSTLIGLCFQGEPVLGLMHFHAMNERWLGEKGEPTRCNGTVVQTRACTSVASAIQTVSSPDFFKTEKEQCVLRSLTQKTAWRVYGGAAYSYGRLASGKTDIALDAGLNIYDYAAMVPIIHGAGGIMTDWQGMPLNLHSKGQVLAAGDPLLHKTLIPMLQEVQIG